MTIRKEIEAKILRYHFVDQWRVGTIATQLGIHHSVVDRVLSQAGMPKVERSPRASIIDPYLPFIIETLKTFPTLTAARLYDMAKQRGYPGGPSLFRQRISQLRPRKQPEAVNRHAILTRILDKSALKSFHPGLLNTRHLVGEFWSDHNGYYCRNKKATFCQ